MPDITVIFTCKTPRDLMDVGGCGWWTLNPIRVKAAGRVLLIHNANDPRQRGDQNRHGQPFMYGTVRDVQQADDGRCLIQFDEYAPAEGAFRWPGNRNPIAYIDEDEVLSSVELGELVEMPLITFEEAKAARDAWDNAHGRRGHTNSPKTQRNAPRSFGAVIEMHRNQLAEELGVDSEKVRISIEA